MSREIDPLDFQPALIGLQNRAPPPLGRAVLWTVLALVALLLVWAMIAKLDIVAVAQGRLVPATYVKIVQPAEQGVIREILVLEGQRVVEGQPLIRMDAAYSQADLKALGATLELQQVNVRRIDAELSGKRFVKQGENSAYYDAAFAQYTANRRALETALAEQKTTSDRARFDQAAAGEQRSKLVQILPHYREQEAAFLRLSESGHVSRVQLSEKQAARIEREQDLRSQEYIINAAASTIEQSERRAEQIRADYEKQLRAERLNAIGEIERVTQDLAKAEVRQSNLELRAPQTGTIKDLATHTAGSVVSPGAVLMTLVPEQERLRAEVWVRNEDVGFVHVDLPTKVKLSTFLFQKYGMVTGKVAHVEADAEDPQQESPAPRPESGAPVYRALIDLESQVLSSDGKQYALRPGMHVSAEIKLGTRTVMEYLLSPVGKAFHEAARER